MAETNTVELPRKMPSKPFNLRRLRISLKYRPNILKLIMKMRHCLLKRSAIIKTIKRELKKTEHEINFANKYTQTYLVATDSSTNTCVEEDNDITDNCEPNIGIGNMETRPDMIDSSTQTEEVKQEEPIEKLKVSVWNTGKENGEEQKSIAEQVKEAAQSAVQQTGMVYVESAGMYYDYKTGYYYNSELGLYYHTDTSCYYTYSDETKAFQFHSYPDRNAVAANALLVAHEKRKAKKHKSEQKKEDSIDNLTKKLSQDNEDISKQATKRKRRKTNKKEAKNENESSEVGNKDKNAKADTDNGDLSSVRKNEDLDEDDVAKSLKEELEDGECSDTASEQDTDEDMSGGSTSSASDDESMARLHPPCMRVIVRETKLPKLKVGTLFLITKDGGTLGREGEQHTIVINDHNVSRSHLDIRFDAEKHIYVATDLGSKNGTILNGSRMSESQIISAPAHVLHGSVIQLGETKLLCHIHPGNDTCGHCEPGLLMETQEKEKVAYTRTCSVQKQHQLELARLKNKYAPKVLCIEETAYNDRAQARRETVGSSHHSEKTKANDLDTCIESENKGFKLLEKMGWSKGEGLGKDSQGDTEPIPLISNDGKAGLGTPSTGVPSFTHKAGKNSLGPATLRLAAKTKMLQPPAKAFRLSDEDSE